MISGSKRVAIVTGSGQGIGRAIALRLANDGYDVALFDLPNNGAHLETLKTEISKEFGTKAISVLGDVTKERDVEVLIEDTVQKLGSLDVMIANAGITYLDLVTELDEQNWDRVFDVNVKGTVFCFKHAAMQMIKQGRGGRIIGASSTMGKQGNATCSSYSASKFAVRGLTQSAALELGKHNITVNAYAPGPINTTFLNEFDKYFVEKEGAPVGAMQESLAKTSPMRRLGRPNDIAALVSFLVRDETSFITGQTIVADGGRHYFD